MIYSPKMDLTGAPPRAFCPTPLAFLALCLAPLAIRLCMYSNNHILLTIDVEDWFQVENFKPWIPFSTWDQRELRLERNVHQLLDLFDSIELNSQRNELNQLIKIDEPSNISEVYLFDYVEVAGNLKGRDVSTTQPSTDDPQLPTGKPALFTTIPTDVWCLIPRSSQYLSMTKSFAVLTLCHFRIFLNADLH